MPRAKSEFTLSMEASRDAQILTTRCSIDGCRWNHTGPAGAGRLLARQHRASVHPDLPAPRIRGRNLPPRETEETSAAIVGAKPWPTRRRITEARARAAAELYLGGLTLREIADLAWTPWGYRSSDSLKTQLPESLRDVGVSMRPRGFQPVRHLDDADALRIVRAAG